MHDFESIGLVHFLLLILILCVFLVLLSRLQLLQVVRPVGIIFKTEKVELRVVLLMLQDQLRKLDTILGNPEGQLVNDALNFWGWDY